MKIYYTIFALLLYSSTYGGLYFVKLSHIDEVFTNSSTYTYSFKFKNKGTDALKILSISTDCGCTSTKISKNIYAPNEEGEVEVFFEISDRAGEQIKRFVVKTDSIQTASHILELKLNILRDVTLKPPFLLWKLNAKPLSLETELFLISENVSNCRVKVIPESQLFDIELKKKSSYSYTLSVTPQSTKKNTLDKVKILLCDENNQIKKHLHFT